RIAVVKDVAGIQVPGTPWATPPQKLEKLAGYWRDIKASRAEARRLLREAGIPEGFSFVFKNRGIPQPYEPLGIWLIDQWRQIGLSVRQETIEASAYHPMLQRGDFDVAMDFQCSFVVEPDMDIDKFQSVGISDRNFGRYKDPVLDDLFMKQARALDPEERKRYLRAFEKRLLDEEAHYLWTLQNHRIVPHSAKVRGWTITPSHFLNQQLDTVWLAEQCAESVRKRKRSGRPRRKTGDPAMSTLVKLFPIVLAALFLTLVLGPDAPANAEVFDVTNLVTDDQSVNAAQLTDPHLKNAWGIS